MIHASVVLKWLKKKMNDCILRDILLAYVFVPIAADWPGKIILTLGWILERSQHVVCWVVYESGDVVWITGLSSWIHDFYQTNFIPHYHHVTAWSFTHLSSRWRSTHHAMYDHFPFFKYTTSCLGRLCNSCLPSRVLHAFMYVYAVYEYERSCNDIRLGIRSYPLILPYSEILNCVR